MYELRTLTNELDSLKNRLNGLKDIDMESNAKESLLKRIWKKMVDVYNKIIMYIKKVFRKIVKLFKEKINKLDTKDFDKIEKEFKNTKDKIKDIYFDEFLFNIKEEDIDFDYRVDGVYLLKPFVNRNYYDAFEKLISVNASIIRDIDNGLLDIMKSINAGIMTININGINEDNIKGVIGTLIKAVNELPIKTEETFSKFKVVILKDKLEYLKNYKKNHYTYYYSISLLTKGIFIGTIDFYHDSNNRVKIPKLKEQDIYYKEERSFEDFLKFYYYLFKEGNLEDYQGYEKRIDDLTQMLEHNLNSIITYFEMNKLDNDKMYNIIDKYGSNSSAVLEDLMASIKELGNFTSVFIYISKSMLEATETNYKEFNKFNHRVISMINIINNKF